MTIHSPASPTEGQALARAMGSVGPSGNRATEQSRDRQIADCMPSANPPPSQITKLLYKGPEQGRRYLRHHGKVSKVPSKKVTSNATAGQQLPVPKPRVPLTGRIIFSMSG